MYSANIYSGDWVGNALAGSVGVLAGRGRVPAIISSMKHTHSTEASGGAAICRRLLFITPEHSPSLSSRWAMKVQLISNSAVHTSRTKDSLRRRGAGNNLPTVWGWENLPEAWRTLRQIKDALTGSCGGTKGNLYSVTSAELHDFSPMSCKSASDASIHSCHLNCKCFVLWCR